MAKKKKDFWSQDIKMDDVKKWVRSLKKEYRMVGILGIAALFIMLVGSVILPAYAMLFVILGFFLVAVPTAILIFLEHQRVESIEEQFPDFLRDIAEYKRSGVTLSMAIQNVTQNEYDQLTPEVHKMAKELSWGMPFEEVLERFGERIDSAMINRALSIIIVAQSVGGEITTILETVAGDMRKLKEIEKERKSKLSVYTMTIYMIYMLLLFIIIVLAESLAPAIPKMQAAGQFLGGTIGTLTEFEFRQLMFHVCVVEAFFAGIIAGQMGEGKITSGIKHAIILVLVTLLAFQLIQPAAPIDKMAETIMEIPSVAGTTSQQIEAIGTLHETLTTEDIAENVRRLAKERGRVLYKDFQADEVEFQALDCKPCAEGKIIVTPTQVLVRETTEIRFITMYAQTRYVVSFRDVGI
jgi:flagellar protein FlaJ